ncbi:type I restriction enzyme HsdR N-terminal domain-containing protein [Methanosarcina barkeri]|uniref:Type I restriction enzyme R protein N-terminal domain-containing protein n=1 Tax=Methanosarcina barkeri (strain Fusaro / DSM 804) TaxID=269797 RepID=Q46AF5_METBF|nr:type I restriction enzyme HsdR N-terminal domain-containing protein [Methanosarcina barkeri]
MIEEGRKKIKTLVEKFGKNYHEYKNKNYSEAQLRIDFINGLLISLGWDVLNKEGKPQHLREVFVEDRLASDEGDHSWKYPDYTLCCQGERKLFLEAKKLTVPIETHKDSALQIRRYGWTAKLPISILCNFEKLIIYDCRYIVQVRVMMHFLHSGAFMITQNI